MSDDAAKMIDDIVAGIMPGSNAASAETAETAEDAAKRKKAVKAAKGAVHVTSGVAHVDASFNNTKVCITDQRGNVLSWCSAGRLGFKGSKKSTAYVGQLVGTDAAKRAGAFGLREVRVMIFGPGAGRESAVRGIASAGVEVSSIEDVTPVPHNGCRPPKRRRI